MPTEALFVLILLAVIVILMMWERLRPDLLALLALLVLTGTGIIPREDAFSSFSRSAAVILIGVFVLNAGLQRAGIPLLISHALLRVAGRSKRRLIVASLWTGAALSLVMNNIASLSLLMPAVVQSARKVRLSPSRILLPLAYATQLGGMATLFTTANIVSNAILLERGLPGFAIYDFLVVGGLAAIAGIVWIAAIGIFLLPRRRPRDEEAHMNALRRTLSDQYRIDEEMVGVRVTRDARVAGKSLAESGLRESLGLSVLAIVRERGTSLSPSGAETVHAGDLLVVSGDIARREAIEASGLQVVPRSAWASELQADELGLHEAIVAPRSRVVGRTIRELHFRSKYGLAVVALWREGAAHWAGIANMPLRFGDALLLHGSSSNVPRLQSDPDWVVLRFDPRVAPVTRKARLATLILVGTLLLAASGLVPIPEAIFAGGLFMVLSGCLSMDEAYQAIDWRTIVLVAGMLPMSTALKATGAADVIGNWIVGVTGGHGVEALLVGLFVFASALSQLIPANAAVPALVAPIAAEAARQAGADPKTFILAVALATSTAFATPWCSSVNAFVMAPGGYRPRDYLVLGLPLAVVTSVVILFVLSRLAPLTIG
jgi:di/tricarboxylate transporter